MIEDKQGYPIKGGFTILGVGVRIKGLLATPWFPVSRMEP